MDQILPIKTTKVKGSEKFSMEDTVIREVKLEIIVNGKNVGALMAVPVDLEELAVGYLMSEDIIEDIKDIDKIETYDVDTKTFQVHIGAKVLEKNIDRLDLEGVIVSGCGRAVSTQISKIAIDAAVMRDNFNIDSTLLFEEMGKFYTQCPIVRTNWMCSYS